MSQNTISIHTPTKGVTTLPGAEPPRIINFNPHSHEGSDGDGSPIQAIEMISIHTPTKGVTPLLIVIGKISTDFNPHSHEGSDVDKI